jgi:hypothetical protein
MISKARLLLACFTTAIVVGSSIYNMTFAFTKNLVREIILEEQRQMATTSYLRNKNSQTQYLFEENFLPQIMEQEEGANTVVPCKETKSEEPTNKSKNEKESWNEIEQVLNHAADKKKTKKESKPHGFSNTNDRKHEADTGHNMPETTVIITTNWMPGLPSTKMVDSVINSLHFLHGLSADTPLIIAADGAYEGGGRHESVRNVDMRNYARALHKNYNNTHTTVLSSSKKIMLVGNMKRALRRVHTEYILVLQHDLPFINDVNHTALIDTMEIYPEVRLVRFPTARVLSRKRDTGVCDEMEIDFKTNDVELTKTHVWSDR